jgi:alpha-ketoglutarate-dependent taurine dioxygenase
MRHVSSAAASALTVTPLAPALGAEIGGIDLARGLDDAAFARIAQAIAHYKVVCLRDQDLSDEAQLALACRFGEPQIHVLAQYLDPLLPAIFMISNLDANGRPNGELPDPGACVWHTDGSWAQIPGRFTFLHGLEVPPEGAETEFTNTELAWQTLDGELQSQVLGLRAVHDLDWSRRQTAARAQLDAAQRKSAPPVSHPIVRRDPDSDALSLFVDAHTAYIEGMDETDGRALIGRIMAHCERPEFTYLHQWREGDLVIWDNRGTMHRATPFDAAKHRRVIRRVTTLDEAPPQAA